MYGHTIWNPYFVRDIELLERVPRRVTRIPPELKGASYVARLRRFKLTTLRDRLLRDDLVETYKNLHGYYSVSENIFHLSDNFHFARSFSQTK